MYSFVELRNKRPVEKDLRQEIFFKLFDIVISREPDEITHSPESIRSDLKGELLVAHNIVRHKGKMREFIGDLVTAPADDFFTFVEEAKRKGDLRSMLVAPASSECLCVLHVSEDAVFSIYFLDSMQSEVPLEFRLPRAGG